MRNTADTARRPVRRLADFAGRDKNSYSAVRLAAAISVIFTHAYGVVGGWEAAEPLAAFTGWSLAAHAVHVFFVLSGFMIAASWERASSLADFAAARLLRIMPGLIAVNIAIVAIAGLWLTAASPSDFWTLDNVGGFLARTLLLFSVGVTLNGVFTDNPMPGVPNIPIWTIRFEIICYVTLMAFMAGVAALRLGGTARIFAVAPVVALSALVISVSGAPEQFGFAAQLARFVLAFYLGVGAWFLRDRIPIRADIAAACAAIAAAAAWSGLPVRYPLMIVATAYVSFWVGSLPMGAVQRWTARTDLSYGVYIAGFFIQQTLVALMPDSGVFANAAIATVLALGAAWLSWTCVEKPALRLRHRLVQPRRASAAIAA